MVLSCVNTNFAMATLQVKGSLKALTFQVFVAALEELETQDHNLNIHCSENLVSNGNCIQYSRLFHPLFLVAVLKPTYMCFQLF
jgi:hypothetical protein